MGETIFFIRVNGCLLVIVAGRKESRKSAKTAKTQIKMALVYSRAGVKGEKILGPLSSGRVAAGRSGRAMAAFTGPPASGGGTGGAVCLS